MNAANSTKSKVLIVTRHAVPNYGSVLQAIATQKAIEELGYTASVLDYKRADETANALANYYSAKYGSPVRKIYYKVVWRLSHSIANARFRDIRNNYLSITEISNNCEIKSAFDGYDHFLTGSDQVWNEVGSGDTAEIDGHYFWEDAKEGSHIIAYAASFGDIALSNRDKAKCAQWLRKFSSVSVREDSGVRLLNQMEYSGTQVLDPTLIVERDYWDKLADTNKKRVKRPYALIYNLHSDSDMKQFMVNNLANTGLKVYNITTTFRRTIGKNIFCPSLEEFLSLFKHADRVYTDSFHAIAMCIIFKTPFVVVLPKMYSTRLESVLRLFHLQGRIREAVDAATWNKESINWKEIDAILAEKKRESIEWLQKALAGSCAAQDEENEKRG